METGPGFWIQAFIQSLAVAALVYVVNKSGTGELRWGKVTLEQIEILTKQIAQLIKDIEELRTRHRDELAFERARYKEEMNIERDRCNALVTETRKSRDAEVQVLLNRNSELWVQMQDMLEATRDALHTVGRAVIATTSAIDIQEDQTKHTSSSSKGTGAGK